MPGSAPSGMMRLTLDQAVSLALKQNPTAQIAIITAAESVQDKNVARSALLPQASLSVTDTAERVNVEAFFGKKIPGVSSACRSFSGFFGGSGIQHAGI